MGGQCHAARGLDVAQKLCCGKPWPGARRDQVSHCDEIHGVAGVLGQVYGADFMPMVINFLDRAKLKGLMDTAVDQPYWPGRRSPFRLDNEQEEKNV